MDDHDDDGATATPLHLVRPFGTGLYRQRVAFVKAGAAPEPEPTPDTGSSVADLYLSIVGAKPADETTTPKSERCDVCHVDRQAASDAEHAACLVHQVALGHSKPPSAIDRARFGLAVMAAQGWDPDSGRGLGRAQQGVPHPIAAHARRAREALGHVETRAEAAARQARQQRDEAKTAKPKSRKELRRLEDERRRRHQRLHEQIMSNRDIEKYL